MLQMKQLEWTSAEVFVNFLGHCHFTRVICFKIPQAFFNTP